MMWMENKEAFFILRFSDPQYPVNKALLKKSCKHEVYTDKPEYTYNP